MPEAGCQLWRCAPCELTIRGVKPPAVSCAGNEIISKRVEGEENCISGKGTLASAPSSGTSPARAHTRHAAEPPDRREEHKPRLPPAARRERQGWGWLSLPASNSPDPAVLGGGKHGPGKVLREEEGHGHRCDCQPPLQPPRRPLPVSPLSLLHAVGTLRADLTADGFVGKPAAFLFRDFLPCPRQVSFGSWHLAVLGWPRSLLSFQGITQAMSLLWPFHAAAAARASALPSPESAAAAANPAGGAGGAGGGAGSLGSWLGRKGGDQGRLLHGQLPWGMFGIQRKKPPNHGQTGRKQRGQQGGLLGWF